MVPSDQASDFDLVTELNCDNSWQINFVIIKSHTDFFPIYLLEYPKYNFNLI